MKKVNLYLFFAVFALLFASCEQDAERVIYKGTGSADVAFSSTNVQKSLAAGDNGTFDVVVYRGNNKGSANIPVVISADKSKKFSLVNSEAVFADGEYKTTVAVSYSYGDLSPIETYSITLKLQDAVSAAGYSTITITAKMKLEYEPMGTGHFTSEFYEGDWDVEVYKAKGGVAAYVIKDCYVEGTDISFIIDGGKLYCDKQFNGDTYGTYGRIQFVPNISKSVITSNGVIFDVTFSLPDAGLAFSSTAKEQIELPK